MRFVSCAKLSSHILVWVLLSKTLCIWWCMCCCCWCCCCSFVSSILRNFYTIVFFSCSRCLCMHSWYGICMLFELRDLVCLIVCCAALCLRCFWFFVLFLVFYIFILQLWVFLLLLFLFTLLLTANGVYVAMVEFFFYLCRLLYYDISSVFVSVDSFHQVRYFIFFLNSVYRIWCFVHFISFIKSVFTSIRASLLSLFLSLLVICASVCYIYIYLYVCLFSSFSPCNNSKEMMEKRHVQKHDWFSCVDNGLSFKWFAMQFFSDMISDRIRFKMFSCQYWTECTTTFIQMAHSSLIVITKHQQSQMVFIVA